MIRPKGILFASFLCVAATGVAAAPSNVQFSAQTLQSSPDKTTRQAQIYVGDNQVRMEYQQDDQKMVEIYDIKNQRALLLMPQQQRYMERKLPKGGMANPMLPPPDMTPCTMVPQAQCRQLGRETLHGRPVIKWEMVVTQDDKPMRSLHWMDVERQMALRQEFPDGTVSEMRLLGQESLHGRPTERWEITTTRADQESMTSTQWYDPELKIAIREELPGGFFRELRNIRLGPQDPQLFTLPAGYQLMKAPQRKQEAPAQEGTQQRSAPTQAPPTTQQRAPYPPQQQQYPAQQQQYPAQQQQYPAQQQQYPAQQQYPTQQQQRTPYPQQQQYPGQQQQRTPYPAQPYPGR